MLLPIRFYAVSPPQAKAMLKDYYIGELVASDPKATATTATTAPIAVTATTATAATDLVTLNPRERVSLTLTEKIEVSHNTRIFRFALPSPQHRLGLPCGKHLLIYGRVNDEPVARAYTPISCDLDLGRLDLLVKVSRANYQ